MKWFFWSGGTVLSAWILLLSGGSISTASEGMVPVATSSGKIFAVDTVGHYVMIQKADGKKVSLELTAETEVTLDGKKLSLDQLDALEKGLAATAEHFTSDSGMQQTIRLTVNGHGAQ